MKREDLVNSASHLHGFLTVTIKEYGENRGSLVASINSKMSGRSDLLELVGENNVQMMKDNHNNHALFIESFMINPDAETLVDTVLWVFRSYRSRGFHQNYWNAQLNCWIEVLEMQLSKESFRDVYPLYQWMIINIPAFTYISDKQLAASLETPQH